MKTKKLNKKLQLNKKTVVDLNSVELDDVRGGVVTAAYTCPGSLTTCVGYCFTPQSCGMTLCTECIY